jgi:ribosome-interacting GTPase 1
MARAQTIAQIESQIKALEFVMSKAVANNEPQRKLFALNGKIRKLRKELEETKKFDWLAR